MFILNIDKKCLKQKNYKDLEIAVSDFISINEISLKNMGEDDFIDIASIIEVIYKEVYCESEKKSDLVELIIKMLKFYLGADAPVYSTSDIEYLYWKLKELETIPQPEQRTPEWYVFRNNRLTASDLWSVIDQNESKMHDILKKKCGVDKPYLPGLALLHGIKFEEVATWIYQQRNQVEMVEFGCLPHRFIPYFGASPDGICGIKSTNKNYIGRMLEIKCPKSRVITGFIPEGYRAQIQGQLEVCDLEYCDYLECDIQVYGSKQAFLDDVYEYNDENGEKQIDYSKTKKGNEKGAVFEIFDEKIKKHLYIYNFDKLNSLDAINSWEDPLFDRVIDDDTLEHAGTTFWYLNNISTVLVKRDREWFTTNFCKIKKFWEDVESARINGIPEKKKKERKIDMTQFTGTLVKPKVLETIVDFNTSLN